MTQNINLSCRFAGLRANLIGLLERMIVALLVLTFFVPVALGQVDRDDSESSSKFGAIDFPYQAIVGARSVQVYSGPDEVHYATDELAAGEVVVVYRHDPNGWCAIRPPAGSFSLLPEAAVEELEDGVGVLVQDEVQAWVGTRLGSVEKPLWQVKLRSNEEVEIIGEASWPSPDGHSTVWYQISPPAGEFRWVKMVDLKIPNAASRSLPEDRDLVVDQKKAREAFVEVRTDDDYVQQAASFGDRIPKVKIRPKAKTRPEAKEKQTAPATSGFVYRSEVNRRSSKSKGLSAPQPPTLDKATVPARDNTAIDFHFRPIGKTALSKPNGHSYSDSGSAAVKHAQAHMDRVERVDRDQDKVVQATYQSPRREAAASGQWKAAANSVRSRVQGVAGNSLSGNSLSGGSLSGSSLQSKSATLARTGTPAAGGSTLKGASNAITFGKTTRARSSVLSDDVSLDVQWERQDDVRRASPVAQVHRSAAQYGAAAEDVVVGSAMFSKLSPQLSQLEMALTNEMLKRPNEWQLSDLELSVERVYAQTNNPVERLQAQRILDKLKTCKKVRSGYAKSFQSSGETFGTSLSPSLRRGATAPVGGGGLAAARGRLNRFGQAGRSVGSPTSFGSSSKTIGVGAAQGLVGSGVDTTVEAGTLYDAHGWLTELVSEDRNNRPVYVLVNDDGKITHHIAPSPGLNLHRYLKSKVGVNGRQGYNNVLKLSHVTVDAVSELIRR